MDGIEVEELFEELSTTLQFLNGTGASKHSMNTVINIGIKAHNDSKGYMHGRTNTHRNDHKGPVAAD